MLIDWIKFGGALLLMFTPAAVFHGSKVRFRPISSDWDRHWSRIFSLGLHAIDLVRATFGAWLLFNALQTAPEARGMARYFVVMTEAGVLALSVAVQTLVCKEPESANAPFAFVTGLVLGTLPPLVTGFVIIVALVISFGARFAAAFFPAVAIFVPAVGFLFTGKRLLLVLVAVAVSAAVPWLLSLLFSRELVVAYRARPVAESRVATGSELR